MDRDDYNALGDQVMAPIRAETNLRWIGFFLTHFATAPGTTWTARRGRTPAVSTWRFLRSEGWGVAPLFVARQFLPPPSPDAPRPPNPEWNEANGITDAHHALALARADDAANLVDIERGATIYLDLEHDGFASVDSAQKYLKGWFDTVRNAGFRPGVYCWKPIPKPTQTWTSDGPMIRSLFPDVAIWLIRIPESQPVVYNEQTGWVTLNPVVDYHDADGETRVPEGYVAAQYAWYNSGRAVHSAKLKTGPHSSHTMAPIDFDAALVSDPSHPEDRAAVAFSRWKVNEPTVIFLYPGSVMWSSRVNGNWGEWVGGFGRANEAPITDLGYGRWFDTRSVAAASRGDNLADLFGLGVDGSVFTCWNVGGDEWSGPGLIGGPHTARHGSAIAAVSRKVGVLDVFFFNVSHEMASTWWSLDSTDWGSHTGAITHGFSFHPASSIDALVSPVDSERLDVFAVDWSNTTRWTQWRSPGPWQSVQVAGGGAVDPALGVHAAWFGGRIHLVAGMRDGTLAHSSHPDGNLATPWASHGAVPVAGPTGRIMGFCVTALDDILVVAGVRSDQTLAWCAFEAGSWSAPGTNIAAPAHSSSGRIGAMRFDGSAVDVVVPNQESSFVYHRLTRGGPGSPPTLSQTWVF
ncbi:glycoside hydrolase domain-containing protein [Nocardia sp. NPDC050793]|uniref:glycoside hydrolase domain-containing protein n=1 Tax=Nocardia sp. NPDC050793 TaxID=3155159 RepID=UPI0033DA36CF